MISLQLHNAAVFENESFSNDIVYYPLSCIVTLSFIGIIKVLEIGLNKPPRPADPFANGMTATQGSS